ncbi:two-component system regulatory protein YycI [Sporosarcina beigongshangi]|uniref:two-component system regulatory protein YycI n=1 Tax=Sporosarcina beigongshangi TaxID=2782538 RepID=UPI00193A3DB4|nr:two-component system regulatory protein YycI [Sporosarcina beigongshangi]
MDWNKTKTIFIIVFSILNIFLYYLYLDRVMETESVQVLGKTSIEESLSVDNITFTDLPLVTKDSSYVSAKIVTFTSEQTKKLENQTAEVVNNTYLQSKMETPISVRSSKGDYAFTEFLMKYVLNGLDYVLWEVNEEERHALFFQKVDNHPIYFSPDAMLVIHWDEEGRVTNYDQRMFGEFVSFNNKKDLLSPIEALGSLSSRGHLNQDSKVKSMKLGYSTLVQLTETQVFAPTWHVHVELKDGTIEDHFIHAVEGKIIEFQEVVDDEHE